MYSYKECLDAGSKAEQMEVMADDLLAGQEIPSRDTFGKPIKLCLQDVEEKLNDLYADEALNALKANVGVMRFVCVERDESLLDVYRDHCAKAAYCVIKEHYDRIIHEVTIMERV